MAHCCSQCSFTAQFESALIMHHQLHHENENSPGFPVLSESNPLKEKASTMPRVSTPKSSFLGKERNLKLPARTSSATKLFEKLRAKICRSKLLGTHRDEIDTLGAHDLSAISECTSKALQDDVVLNKPGTTLLKESAETYGCHLCSFDADRITVLDRHLLNDHKIGLEHLLKLVMAKTKENLNEEDPVSIFGIRQPYYKPEDEIIQDGDYIIETVTPKIKILKHSATNTDIQWNDIPNLKDNCRMITRELEKLINFPNEKCDKEFSEKMQTLNECMCKFVNSSNTLRKVVTKELDSKSMVRDRGGDEAFNLGLGDRGTPRDWERAHSERLERSRKKIDNENRNDKSKFGSESFCF